MTPYLFALADLAAYDALVRRTYEDADHASWRDAAHVMALAHRRERDFAYECTCALPSEIWS